MNNLINKGYIEDSFFGYFKSPEKLTNNGNKHKESLVKSIKDLNKTNINEFDKYTQDLLKLESNIFLLDTENLDKYSIILKEANKSRSQKNNIDLDDLEFIFEASSFTADLTTELISSGINLDLSDSSIFEGLFSSLDIFDGLDI